VLTKSEIEVNSYYKDYVLFYFNIIINIVVVGGGGGIFRGCHGDIIGVILPYCSIE
jgi:hypothetical protein